MEKENNKDNKGGVTPQRLEDFFKENNFSYKSIFENIWKIDFGTKEIPFPLFLRLTSDWITLAILEYTYISESDSTETERIQERLLTLNEEIAMAKFVLDQDNSVSLVLDLPIENLRLDKIKESINLLLYYGKKYWDEFSHEKPSMEF